MIKINKDLTDIPCSLKVNDNNLTHRRRKELIAKGAYIDEKAYDDRYKTADIKERLKILYHHKCAYCEYKVEQGHIEHYRPKQIYYWLAYSWDNLLYCCPTCNLFKGTNFEIKGVTVNPPKETDDLSDINIWSSIKYDKEENPQLLNPERDELKNVFVFDVEGHIKGNNCERATYTIEKCHLDRIFLVDERRKIIDDLKNNVKAEILSSKTKDVQKERISLLTEHFLRSAMDKTNTFTAYRVAAIEWLDDIVKDILRGKEE